MQRWFIRCCLVAVSLFSLDACCGQTAPVDDGSFLLLDGPSAVSLGKIPATVMQTVLFRFKNPGKATVDIQHLRASCSCLKAQTSTNRVPAGGEAVITLRLDPSDIDGTFRRTLWVGLGREGLQQNQVLILSGEVPALFAGVPEKAITLAASALPVVWTNRFTITAAEPGLRLVVPAEPLPQADSNLLVSVEVVPRTNRMARVESAAASVAASTNRAAVSEEEAAQVFDVTLRVTPLTPGQHRVRVTLPVEGKPGLKPLNVDVVARIGLSLVCSPNKLYLYSAQRALTRRLLLRTDAANVDSGLLTWEPHLEGVTLETKLNKAKTGFLASLTFSPEAIRRVKEGKESRIVFQYPNHTAATLLLFPAREDTGTDIADKE